MHWIDIIFYLIVLIVGYIIGHIVGSYEMFKSIKNKFDKD